MSKKDDALTLALEALEQIDEAMPFPVAKLAQKVIREALAEQQAQQHIEHCIWARNGNAPCPHVPPAPVAAVNTSSERVDKTEENVHEQPAQQQEPVYWQWRRKDQPWSLEYTFNSEVHVTTKDSERRALYTSPQPACKPCKVWDAEGYDALCQELEGWKARALKAEQPAQQQEPIYQYQMANGSWIDQTKESHDYNLRHGQATVRVVYTSPQPSKLWVGLTQEDMYEIGEFKNTHGYVPTGFKRLVAAIEAKLKEKNGF